MKHTSASRAHCTLMIACMTTLLLAACMTTTTRTSTTRSSAELEEKAGSKDTRPVNVQPPLAPPTAVAPPAEAVKQTETPAAPIVLAPTATPERLLEFIRRHSTTNGPLGEDDEQLLSLITLPAETGSLGEAALALAAIKTAVVQTGAIVGGLRDTSALPTSSRKPTTSTRVDLEGLMFKRKVDFPIALEANPFLQGYTIYSMTSALLEKTYDSQEYKDKINGIIQNQANRWAALNPRNLIPPLLAAPNAQTPPMGSLTSGLPSGLPTPPPVDMAKVGTDPVGDAQTLANQSRYRDAVAKIRQVPPGHPQYTQAQERIKTYSNKAVQDLRRRAAKAMQDANSASDTRTRVSYLQQAKTHLESAINDFPEADMLGTVQENLEYITGNIEKLKN